MPDPHNIRMWCLGNEMDGPWQLGHKSATEYGRLAGETAKAMRQIDPSIELVVCGSSNERMPTFGSWEAEVLEHTYDDVDFISLHAYFDQTGDDRVGFLASAHRMDQFIEGVIATCDHVGAKKHSRRKLQLSFDEWNLLHEGRYVGADNTEWTQGPRMVEDDYTVEDAVVLGNLLMSLLRHSDRVTAASQAQLVNLMAPIRSEPDTSAWRQTIFYPFALTARHARGQVLRVETASPTLHSETLGDVAAVDVVATYDAAAGEIAVFAINRDENHSADVRLRLNGLDAQVVAEHLVLGGSDLLATNTKDAPNRVGPRKSTEHVLDGDQLSVVLPPVSWSMTRIALAS